jgi:hypothetical protein
MIPELEPVVSSNVAAIGYDEGSQELYVEFLDSGLYCYSGVPLPIWQDFQASGSKGGYLNSVIKPAYPAQKI